MREGNHAPPNPYDRPRYGQQSAQHYLQQHYGRARINPSRSGRAAFGQSLGRSRSPYSSGARHGRQNVAYAGWGLRVVALMIDSAVPAVPIVLVTSVLALLANSADGAVMFGVGAHLASAGVVAFWIWNTGFRQGRTGQSLGKSAMGIRVVGAQTGRPVGVGASIARGLAHVLDALPFSLGFLWPLWDERSQTFADKICDTVVLTAPTR